MTLRGRRDIGKKILAQTLPLLFAPTPTFSDSFYVFWPEATQPAVPLPRYHEPVNPPSTERQPLFPNIITSNRVQGQTEGRGPTKVGVLAEGGLTSSWYRGGGTYITPRGDLTRDTTTTIPRARQTPLDPKSVPLSKPPWNRRLDYMFRGKTRRPRGRG